MNILELELKVGNKYIDQDGRIWEVFKRVEGVVGNDKFDLKDDSTKTMLTSTKYLSEILKMDFEPYTDWSKIKINTRVLFKLSKKQKWLKGHFAGYKNGEVYVFCKGRTSWSVYSEDEMFVPRIVKLTEQDKTNFIIEEYSDEDATMHCDSKEESDIFRNFLTSKGRKWSTGASYSKVDPWDELEGCVCYLFNKGTYIRTKPYLCDKELYFKDYSWLNLESEEK